jgi:hypothetical protein
MRGRVLMSKNFKILHLRNPIFLSKLAIYLSLAVFRIPSRTYRIRILNKKHLEKNSLFVGTLKATVAKRAESGAGSRPVILSTDPYQNVTAQEH